MLQNEKESSKPMESMHPYRLSVFADKKRGLLLALFALLGLPVAPPLALLLIFDGPVWYENNKVNSNILPWKKSLAVWGHKFGNFLDNAKPNKKVLKTVFEELYSQAPCKVSDQLVKKCGNGSPTNIFCCTSAHLPTCIDSTLQLLWVCIQDLRGDFVYFKEPSSEKPCFARLFVFDLSSVALKHRKFAESCFISEISSKNWQK